MVKNISGGNRTKKQKRNFSRYDAIDKIEQGQMFGEILQNNGGSFTVLCSDGLTRLGKLSGMMKKGPRIKIGTFIVLSLREFESDQTHCDIFAFGNPTDDILKIFKRNTKSNKKDNDIEFIDVDTKFNDLHLSNDINNIDINKDNEKDNEKIDWDNI